MPWASHHWTAWSWPAGLVLFSPIIPRRLGLHFLSVSHKEMVVTAGPLQHERLQLGAILDYGRYRLKNATRGVAPWWSRERTHTLRQRVGFTEPRETSYAAFTTKAPHAKSTQTWMVKTDAEKWLHVEILFARRRVAKANRCGDAPAVVRDIVPFQLLLLS